MSDGEPVKESAKESLKDKAINKLLGQEANTIVLIAILCAIGYSFWWAMTTGVPAHLSQIQAGYEKIDERHEKSRADDRALFKETLDRIERRSAVAAAGKGD